MRDRRTRTGPRSGAAPELRGEIDDDERDEQFLDKSQRAQFVRRLENTGLACHHALRYAIARWWTSQERDLHGPSFEAAGLTIT